VPFGAGLVVVAASPSALGITLPLSPKLRGGEDEAERPQHLLCWRMESNNDLPVLVVLELDTIVVTLPGTSYSVSYRKVRDTPWLAVSDVRDDPDSQINKYTFRAQAWMAANDKARELGWTV